MKTIRIVYAMIFVVFVVIPGVIYVACSLAEETKVREKQAFATSTYNFLIAIPVKYIGVVVPANVDLEVYCSVPYDNNVEVSVIVIQKGTRIIKFGSLEILVDGEVILDLPVRLGALRSGEAQIIKTVDESKRLLRVIEAAPKAFGVLPEVDVKARVAVIL